MNLLIVDDDMPTIQAIVESVSKMTIEFGNVYTASNVMAAKKIIEQSSVDIVVCDIEMPKYSGLDLIEWARQNKHDAEFIFLTCHAEFTYAAKALKFKADAYITKPLDFAVLQNALIQVVEKISYNKEMKKRSEFGELWLDSRERLENALWRELLFSDITAEFKTTAAIEERQRANIDFNAKYRLILCSFLETQVSECGWRQPTFKYAASNIAGDIFFGGPNAVRVFDYNRSGHVYIAAIVDEEAEDEKEKCGRFVDACDNYLQCGVVVYLSAPGSADELADLRSYWQQIDENNVDRSVKLVMCHEQLKSLSKPESLNVDYIQRLLLEGNTAEPIELIRKHLNKAGKDGQLSAQTLHSIHQDYTQIIFSLLHNENIMAHQLFSDKNAKRLEKMCELSSFDMIKWVSFITEKTVSFISESRESETVVGKMKRFIEDNLNKEISRDDVAAHVFLSADYVSKIFKAETGFFLKDYINERKIEKAKALLREDKKNISEIASAVGFDNFSYFSTLFKKSTGLSPSEYKKSVT